ncbi:hypothetical protein CSPAE12_03638 [Colletotrichum incanum]|nr:hypothetical protein CSPAE12_03638 [Colletotrichum incanum]
MDGDDLFDAWKQELGRHPPWMRGFERFPEWLRDIWHDVGCFLIAWLYIAVFEYFCFRDVFLKTVFLVLIGNHTIVKSRWLFGALAFTVFGEIEVCKKFAHAVMQSSHVFFIELALIFLVFPLHFWRSPARLIPEDRYVVAWGVLTSFVCAVADKLDDHYGMRKWHSLAERNPAFLCKSAEPFSLYTTCSHYAALILLIRELDFTFDGYQSDAIEEAEEALEPELTTIRIWMYRIRFLFWGLLVQLSVNVAFELVSDAAGWMIEQMHMWVYPEEYEDPEDDKDDEDEDEDDVDWNEEDEDDEATGEVNTDEVDTDEEGSDEGGTHDADGTEDTNISDSEKTVNEIDEEDEDEDGNDYVYIHKDD